MGQRAIERRREERHVFYDEAVENIRLITERQEALEFIKSLGDKLVALDFETTGLSPNNCKVRLSCIYHPDCGIVLLDHFFCGSFNDLATHMLGPMWAVYNAKFEVRWFDFALRNTAVDLIDVDFLAKAVRGGGHSSLSVMAKRDLGIELDKEQQRSDWSQIALTEQQIRYAGYDAVVTYKLAEYWMKRASEAQREGAFVFQDAVRATVECEQTGLVLDTEHHEKNIKLWKMKQALMNKRVRKFLPTTVVKNLNSPKQMSDMLKTQLGASMLAAWPKTEKTEQLSMNRKQIGLLVAKSPYPFSRFMNAYMRFRFYAKYLSTYGETLLTKQYLEDKISYRLNIGAAATGRYSSSSINIQNIPRNPFVRKAFLPPVGYEYLVVADYSGIEVRVLAELSQDKQLLRDAIYGDVHSGSASAIYGIPEDEFLEIINDETAHDHARFKELRSRAKGFTFQNVYGAGAGALSVVLRCSFSEAEEALRKWAERYPDAYNYRHIMFDKMNQKGYLPVCDGRTIFVSKRDRTLPVASNYGIQGAAASVMLRAMHHVYELRNVQSRKRDIVLAATVHDEMLLGVRNESLIGESKKLLVTGMERGWLDIFPDTSLDNLVEAKHGITWGHAK